MSLNPSVAAIPLPRKHLLRFDALMDPAYEEKYHAMEDHHWWFVARRDLIVRLLPRLRIAKNASILEIGCSGGPLLEALSRRGYKNLCGIDISESAIARSRARGFSDVHQQDATAPSLPHRLFDLLIASDILEHLEHPDIALRNWKELLHANGKLFVLVPAFMTLWSGHDVVNHHFRRYTASLLAAQLENAGWKVERIGYWNGFLFPPTALVRIAARFFSQKKVPQDQLIPLLPGINSFLTTLVQFENALIHSGAKMPLGVSVFAIAQRKH